MPALLSRLADEAAMRRPEAPAVRCAGETLTWEELARRAHGLARVLLDAGLRPRARVAVLLAKGLDVPVAFHGALAAGGTLVPIDPRSPAEQVVRVLRATGATHLVTEPGRREVAARALAACPGVTHAIGLDGVGLDGAGLDGAGLDGAAEIPAAENPVRSAPLAHLPWSAVAEAACDRPPPVDTIGLDPAYVLHTSGSTGEPKLIQHTHAAAMAFVDWAVAEYALTPDDRITNHSSHHTCFATFDYWATARAGATTVVLPPAVLMMPPSLSRLLEEERISVWYSVPTALVQLSLRGELEERDLAALRWVLFAGESFPAKHLRRLVGQLPGARFSHVYGSTETNVCTRYHLPDDADLDAPLPIGTACAGARTVVVDEELAPVADGEVGELLVRGSAVMSGYWGEPERNRQALVRRPAPGGFEEVWFRTGDRVRRLPGGDLAFVTRSDLQVKVRGHRVELEEVEAALLGLAAVEQAAAFTVADPDGGATLRAAVVLAAGSPATPREIEAGLRRVLPPHAVPAGIAVLDGLPRTPTGKVDRNALSGDATPAEVDGGD